MNSWQLFLTVYTLIFFAELPDKTAFATLLMSTRERPTAILIGAALAFLAQSTIALFFGSLLGLLPERWVHLGAGLLFFFFAFQMWFSTEEETESESETDPASPPPSRFRSVVFKAFLMIFIAEWGDITQVSSITLMAQYHDQVAIVFIAALLALISVAGLAILIGQKAKSWIQPEILKKTSAGLFVLIGTYFLATWFRP